MTKTKNVKVGSRDLDKKISQLERSIRKQEAQLKALSEKQSLLSKEKHHADALKLVGRYIVEGDMERSALWEIVHVHDYNAALGLLNVITVMVWPSTAIIQSGAYRCPAAINGRGKIKFTTKKVFDALFEEAVLSIKSKVKETPANG